MFQPPARKKKRKPFMGRSTATLEHAQLATTTLAILADDALSVPGLKAVCGIANQIISLAQNARTNKEECQMLAQGTRQVIEVLLSATSGCSEDSVSHRFKIGVERLSDEMEEIRRCMVEIGSRSLFKGMIKLESDRARIGECREKLSQAQMKFLVYAQIVQHTGRQSGDVNPVRHAGVDTGFTDPRLYEQNGEEQEKAGESAVQKPTILQGDGRNSWFAAEIYAPATQGWPRVKIDAHIGVVCIFLS
ncbi:hypothetical protein GLOTRDRAFT_117411 [Gloeophyllum trabeum ATCC 11539]|uniref:Uncharacterized protein n=1 Tax=Gloeophyllum trabeum (strain ATCC 11539 / FP-39264 / Madison 617) TaxID=670483 RepID=S7RJ30_GLOTA|nr:uncharacterized protein GLOTRDRAFT_117411 [Gloeophyllum trabeum ATCC 11539]EPQ52629.1 hypothetical protein GLOTRDRAFT_117411 [Gloeophyllum trabeum ATCC 11539]